MKLKNLFLGIAMTILTLPMLAAASDDNLQIVEAGNVKLRITVDGHSSVPDLNFPFKLLYEPKNVPIHSAGEIIINKITLDDYKGKEAKIYKGQCKIKVGGTRPKNQIVRIFIFPDSGEYFVKCESYSSTCPEA